MLVLFLKSFYIHIFKQTINYHISITILNSIQISNKIKKYISNYVYHRFRSIKLIDNITFLSIKTYIYKCLKNGANNSNLHYVLCIKTQSTIVKARGSCKLFIFDNSIYYHYSYHLLSIMTSFIFLNTLILSFNSYHH